MGHRVARYFIIIGSLSLSCVSPGWLSHRLVVPIACCITAIQISPIHTRFQWFACATLACLTLPVFSFLFLFFGGANQTSSLESEILDLLGINESGGREVSPMRPIGYSWMGLTTGFRSESHGMTWESGRALAGAGAGHVSRLFRLSSLILILILILIIRHAWPDRSEIVSTRYFIFRDFD
jgi:hypothetical protein